MDLSNFRRSRTPVDDSDEAELPRRAPRSETAAPLPSDSEKPKRKSAKTTSLIVLLFIVICCLIGAFILKNNQTRSDQRIIRELMAAKSTTQITTPPGVDRSKYQAVFLANGQTYFGKVTSVNTQYLTLTNIYYLNDDSGNQTSQKATTSTALTKLGCEIHAPEDKMTINMAQVNYWENIKSNGDVAKGIQTFTKTHPDGSCS